MEKLEIDNRGWLNTGSQRTVGFRHTFALAEEAVKENMCDIWETVYNYAVIEEVEPTIYPDCLNRWFYCYNRRTGKYESIEEPDCAKNWCGFALG